MKSKSTLRYCGFALLLVHLYFFQPLKLIAQEECSGYAVELFITGDTDLEGSWAIGSGGLIASGPYLGGAEVIDLCLEDLCYNMMINIPVSADQEGYWVILHADTAVVGGYFADGTTITTFGFSSDACSGSVIYGCTDPAALNYNPEATADGGNCIYDDNDCGLDINVLQQTCGLIQLKASLPNPPFPLVTWTVNGESVFTLPGAGLAYELDGAGDYEFCASIIGDGCEVCETVEVTQGCDEDCGELSIEFVNEDDPTSGCIAWFAPIFDGDLQDGMIFWDMGAGSSPILSNDSMVGYQYAPGTYEICATFSSTNCSSSHCMEVTIGDCSWPAWGCTDPEAINYDPEATVDDGSCIYDEPNCSISFYAEPDSINEGVIYIVMEGNYTDADSVLWDFGDGNISSEFFPSYTYEGTGPYELCVYAVFSDEEGTCTAVFCMEINETLLGRMAGLTIQVVDGLSLSVTDLAERLEPYPIALWPNPASHTLQVMVQAPSSELLQMRVFDLSGKTLVSRTEAASPGEVLIELSIGDLSPGVYLLNLQGAQGQHTKRFVVSR